MAAAVGGACLEARLDRRSAIVAVGGGAAGDLAGFVAATYQRGIAFVQVPTTLLAMVDASVGGKVAINLPRAKNMVGAFHQPRLVVADLATLTTLPDREYRSGLAEVVKHGIIRDRGLFQLLETETQAVLNRDPGVMAGVVERNCRIKGAVVSADEREGGLRTVLNLGHTVGHAVEAVAGRLERDGDAGEGAGAAAGGQVSGGAPGSGVSAPGSSADDGLLHGECVAIGLVAAARLSARSGVLAQPDLPERLEALLRRFGLPVRLPPGVDPAAVEAAMAYDKKATGGQLRWVLPVRIGQVQVTTYVLPEDVRAVLEELRS
nr:MAG: 3-dehydroquinate synthase [Bacillota bacterium]